MNDRYLGNASAKRVGREWKMSLGEEKGSNLLSDLPGGMHVVHSIKAQ